MLYWEDDTLIYGVVGEGLVGGARGPRTWNSVSGGALGERRFIRPAGTRDDGPLQNPLKKRAIFSGQALYPCNRRSDNTRRDAEFSLWHAPWAREVRDRLMVVVWIKMCAKK